MPATSHNLLSPTAPSVRRLETENRLNLTPRGALLVCCVVGAASLALLPVWAADLSLWTIDPLRSIGGFFPLLAFAGTIAAWRRTGWRNEGTWWGLPVAVAAMAGATLFSSNSLLTFFFHREVRLLHPGMASLLYGVGAALLFGGKRLLRLARAPLCLLLIVNPVPEAFKQRVDMPLQILSADTARAFAHAIGLQPTGDQLRMMFAPHFGMMIVPGCNGLRGAITLGYLALIYGYVRRLSPRVLAALTIGGVLLGYLLNLLRLCLLVCYYRLGITVQSIQSYGTQVDYVIGVSLFLCATVLIGWVAGMYFPLRTSDAVEPPAEPATGKAAPPLLPRVAALGLAGLAFFIPQARSVAAHYQPRLTETQVVNAFPQVVGPYALTKKWDEFDAEGNLRFVWVQYERNDGREAISMAVYLVDEDHLVSMSKLMQGVHPAWTGKLDAPRPTGEPMRFITSFYRDGAARSMDAETSCEGEVCELKGGIEANGRFTFVAPHLADLFIDPAERRLPLILRMEWSAGDASSDDQLREEFVDAVREFARSLNLAPLVTLERERSAP